MFGYCDLLAGVRHMLWPSSLCLGQVVAEGLDKLPQSLPLLLLLLMK